MHMAGGGHRALVYIGLVVLFDVLELIAIVAHESVRLAQALCRDIPLPIDALETGAVAEVETRDGIDRLALGSLDVEKIMGGKTHEDRPQGTCRGRIDPGRVLQHAKEIGLGGSEESKALCG